MIAWVVSSSLLIVLVLALRALLKDRLSPRLRYALWLLVLLRLLIPGTLSRSPVSVQNALPASLLEVSDRFAETAVSAPLPVSRSETAAPATPLVPVPEGAVERPLRAAELLRFVWLGGTALFLLGVGASNLRFTLRLRRSRVRRKDVESRLPVYTVPWLSTPCLAGLFRPAVYLTEGLEGEALRHVLTHEETHYRQGDPLWSRLRLLALALHWYNPLVWIAALQSKRDAELSCDAGTLLCLGEGERLAYGETLLRLSGPRFAHLLNLSTAMTDSRRSLTERIRFIARRPRTAMTTLLLVLLLAAFAAASAFTGAPAAASERLDETVSSDDGTVTAALRFPTEETLFPEGAPVLTLTPHEITIDEVHRIVSAVFGENAPVWQDMEENLYLQSYPVATQETLDRWLTLAAELQENDFYEKVSDGNENVLRHRREELADFIAYYGDPAFYASMPRDADRLPMVWDGSVRQGLAEKDGISYRIANTPHLLPEPAWYTLSIAPEDARPYALYSYVLKRTFGEEEVSDSQLEAAREQVETLAARMGLSDWYLSDCRIVSFPYPAYETVTPRRGMIHAELKKLYDPRLPDNLPPRVLSAGNTLSLELSADGRLINLYWNCPLDVEEVVSENASLLSWREILEAIRTYVRQSRAEDFGSVTFLTDGEPRVETGASAKLELVSLRPRLSYVERTPGAEDGELIPSVAVFGDVTLLDASGAELSLDGAAYADLPSPDYPLFVLSALDGSVLEDRTTPYSMG